MPFEMSENGNNKLGGHLAIIKKKGKTMFDESKWYEQYVKLLDKPHTYQELYNFLYQKIPKEEEVRILQRYRHGLNVLWLRLQSFQHQPTTIEATATRGQLYQMGSPKWGDGLESETIAAVYYIKEGLEHIGMDNVTLVRAMEQVFRRYMHDIRIFNTQTCDLIISELKEIYRHVER